MARVRHFNRQDDQAAVQLAADSEPEFVMPKPKDTMLGAIQRAQEMDYAKGMTPEDMDMIARGRQSGEPAGPWLQLWEKLMREGVPTTDGEIQAHEELGQEWGVTGQRLGAGWDDYAQDPGPEEATAGKLGTQDLKRPGMPRSRIPPEFGPDELPDMPGIRSGPSLDNQRPYCPPGEVPMSYLPDYPRYS